MISDGHIHIKPGQPEPEKLTSGMLECGISSGVLISIAPEQGPFDYRLNNLKDWTGKSENLIPFLWIDPIETGALGQVKKAIEAGVAGFKIICDKFYPADQRCMSVCKMAADAGKPVLFHSGILWDGKPSSEFCRPVNFECLFGVNNLRFSLAHIGWPWCDEMIAVYGKFLNFKSRNPRSHTEMYIDMTPGTPEFYRREVITKIFRVGYDISNNLIFGTDCEAIGYNTEWTLKWIDTDNEIYSDLQVDKNTIDAIYKNNLEAFISGGRSIKNYKDLIPAVL